MAYEECTLIGRNAVLEGFRSGKTIDKLFILDGCQDGPVKTILREAKKQNTLVKFVSKEKLDSLSDRGKHQGVVAIAAAFEYAELEDLFKKAEEKGGDPFFILCDEIEDPHNLGAIIRTANLAGAHGVKASCRWTDKHCGKSKCRCPSLHPGCPCDESCKNDRRVKRERYVVCLCRYGRRSDVPSESHRTNWSSHRKRRKWRKPPCQRKM